MKAYFRQVITVEADELPDNITAAQLKDMAKPDGLLDYMIRRGALRCTTAGWVVTSTTPNLTRGDRRILNDKPASAAQRKRGPYKKYVHWTRNKAKLKKAIKRRKKTTKKRAFKPGAVSELRAAAE